jgi:hypothetical protein
MKNMTHDTIVKKKIYYTVLLPLTQYIRRNHLWFKDQETYLIFSVNTRRYVRLERTRFILWDMNKK